MATAPIIADFLKARCGECKVVVPGETATHCPICGSVFDRITSNHVGLAERLLGRRKAAGVEFETATAIAPASAPPVTHVATAVAEPEVAVEETGPHTAPIIVDLYTMRCGECKVLLADENAQECPTCGAIFDRIVSNHVGLAAKYEKMRAAAAVG